MACIEPGEKPHQIGDKQRGIDGHVENAGHQRKPCLLKSPEISERAPNPRVVAAFMRERAGEFAHHERGGHAPENRREQKNQNAAAVARAMDDVFRAVRAPRNHKEGRRDKRPQAKIRNSFRRGRFWEGGWFQFISNAFSAALLLRRISAVEGNEKQILSQGHVGLPEFQLQRRRANVAVPRKSMSWSGIWLVVRKLYSLSGSVVFILGNAYTSHILTRGRSSVGRPMPHIETLKPGFVVVRIPS